MTKAYRCDICEDYYDNDPDVQLVRVGVNWSPEISDGDAKKVLDLCPRCSECYAQVFIRFKKDMVEFKHKCDCKRRIQNGNGMA